jgi:uroporphyrinogen-III synthase
MTPHFQGRRVLSLESRRATELAALISTYGGEPLVAPALREAPLESNTKALDFADALIRGELDLIIFLTGAGTRALLEVIERKHSRRAFVDALARARIVARGPKPLAVLRELGVPVWAVAPEPNTWHELVAALDAKAAESPLAGARVAVQEYGVANPELLDALRRRGAQITQVPVYRWELPVDVKPLKDAVISISRNEVDVALFTTGVQVVHLWQIATGMHLEEEARRGLAHGVVASIGPTTSEELVRHGLQPDLEASRPKIGYLVREAAERCEQLLRTKRPGA